MSLVIDSYSGSNNGTIVLGSADNDGAGQSFTGDGNPAYTCMFIIRKVLNPTGNAVAKIYAHTGTFGTTGIPTGSALATSDNIDVSTLSINPTEIVFNFSTAFTTVNTTNYFVTVEYSGGDASNNIDVQYDGTSPSHGGNTAVLDAGSWTANSTRDHTFNVLSSLVDTVPDRFSMMGL